MSLVLDLPADDPSIAALDPDARARVALIWTERSAAEQRAAVLFTLVARDLMHRADGMAALCVELEDPDMDRESGAREACQFVRNLDFTSSKKF